MRVQAHGRSEARPHHGGVSFPNAYLLTPALCSRFAVCEILMGCGSCFNDDPVLLIPLHLHIWFAHVNVTMCATRLPLRIRFSVFTNEEERFAWNRTVSRLGEMRTAEYWRLKSDSK